MDNLSKNLFKGKDLKNGEWFFGGITSINHSIGERGFIVSNIHFDGCEDEENFELVEVHPETVSQFTGLLDKNGKRIFEGDVLKCVSPNDGHEFNSGFIASLDNGITFKSLDLHRDMVMYDYEWMEIEVIGNIHDNPGLIENDK